MANVRKAWRLIATYLTFYVGFYLVATVATAIYLNSFSNDGSGSGLGVILALPIMFVLYSVLYFFVPGSTLLALVFLGDFMLRDRGSKLVSLSASVAMAVAIWLITFPPAVSLINLIYADNYFLMLKDSSWTFIYLLAGTNLLGLIGAVIWVKLQPQKTN